MARKTDIRLRRSATSGAIPTTSQLNLGELAINTYDGKLFLKKDVAGTQSVVEIGSGEGQNTIWKEYEYTSTSNQTTFSGSDNNNQTLSYLTGAIQVFLNGVLQEPTTDYTATSGSSVVFVNGLSSGEIVQIASFAKVLGVGDIGRNTYSGDGATNTFTLGSDPEGEDNLFVFIDGVYQEKSTFSHSGTTLTFSTAPANGTTIEVMMATRNVSVSDVNDFNVGGNLTVDGYADLDLFAVHSATTKTYEVKVITKTSAHRYNGTGSSSGYTIDGVEAPGLRLYPGRTYKFDQSDSSNSGHPFRFYEEANKTTAYTTGVTTSGTPGSSGAYTQIVVSDSTPLVLHYQCSAHGYMGNQVNALTGAASISSTDDVSEGSNNLYFTNERVDDRVNALLQAGTGITLTYNDSGNTLTIAGAAQYGDSDVESYLDANGITLPDSINAKFGTGNDLQIYHDGSDSYINQLGTGNLIIRNSTDDKDINFQSDDGSGSVATYFQLDGSQVQNKFLKNTVFLDNVKAQFGTGTDLQIYHDGSNSYIRDLGTGNLRIDATDFYVRNSAGTELKIGAVDDGAVTLYYDGSAKLATKSDGVDITGELQSDSLDVDGNADISGNLVLGGNLTISGTTTTVNSTTLDVADLNITVGKNATTSAATDGAGLTFGAWSSGTIPTLTWNHSNTYLTSNKTFNVGGSSGSSLGVGYLSLKNSGTQSYIDFFCETGNAHYARLQAPAHSAFSGNITLTLPATTDTLVGRTTTDTLTNKTLTSPTINGTISSASDLTFDLGADLIVDVDGGDIKFKDAGTVFGGFSQFLGSMVIRSGPSDTAMIIGDSDGDVIMGGDVGVGTNKKLYFASNDLQIYHDGTDSFVDNNDGDLKFRQLADDKDIIFQSDNGSGGTTDYIRLDGSASLTKFNINTKHLDDVKATFGDSADLEIYHDGANNYIDTSTGSLLIRNTNDDYHVIIQSDNGGGGVADYFRAKGDTGEAILYHYGNEKVKTTSSGVQTTGTVNVNGAFALPTSDGSSNQVLQTDGSGNVSWATVSASNSSGLVSEAFKNILVSGQSNIVADSATDSLTFAAGSGITLTTNASSDTITITNSATGDNAFGNIAVSGQTTVAADSTNDTLTLVGTNGVDITTTAGSDTITFDGKTSYSPFTTDFFTTSNASTTAFVLSKTPSSEDNLIVFLEGVYQNKNSYSLSSATLTLDSAPASGQEVVVHIVGDVISGEALTRNNFTGDGSTTDFTLTLAPMNENNCYVYSDGVYQEKSEFSVSGTTLSFGSAPASGASLEVLIPKTTTIDQPATGSIDDITLFSGIQPSTITSTTVASTSATTIATHAAASFRTVKYLVQCTQGTDYHSTEINLIHDGTTVYITEYGTLYDNASLGTFNATISGGNILLQITAGSSTSMAVKVVSTAIPV